MLGQPLSIFITIQRVGSITLMRFSGSPVQLSKEAARRRVRCKRSCVAESFQLGLSIFVFASNYSNCWVVTEAGVILFSPGERFTSTQHRVDLVALSTIDERLRSMPSEMINWKHESRFRHVEQLQSTIIQSLDIIYG